MATHGTAHWDVAAYALGVLDPQEVVRCEAHLAECPSCAAELDSLLPTTKLLADVDLETLREAEETQLAERLADAVRTERYQTRSRRRTMTTVGTAVAAGVAGFALFAGATWLSPAPAAEVVASADPTPSATPSTGPLGGRTISNVDPETGVAAEVGLQATAWGTQVSFTISSVTGPLECQLLLVRADGTTEVVGSWRVPEKGYGTVAQPDPLLLRVPTAADRADIIEFVVRATAPDGTTSPLVTVAL